ncbi:hypothetical protein N431DRAFT_484441 [Stipitochalara longipes BDJ]|nr:hypothetical protein N431DRAFT_484441 [Stipitochalara longipes BDJ]
MQSFIKSVTSRSGGRRKKRDRGHRDEATTIQQPPTATTPTPNVERGPSEIFASASALFVDLLREDERVKFTKFDNAQSMLQNCQQLARDNPGQKSRILSCCHKLQLLTSTLGPFFEIVNNLVGSPECAGVAWGALRLISVLGVNYVSFLEKMGNMFEQMAAALSIFEEFSITLRNRVNDPVGQGYTRITQLLAQVYSDLIHFCHRACKLFTPSETNILVLQKRIRAPGWAANFEHARNHRVAETGHWLLNDSIFCQHVNFTHQAEDDHQQNILFVSAKPGYGKTTLATLVIDQLKPVNTYLPNSQAQHLAFYFFDKQNGNASHSYDAYRALLSQLVHLRRFDEKVIDIASIARPDHDTGQSFASDDEVFDVLHLLLLHIGPCVLVLDGVDECANREDLFKGLCRIALDHKQHCRIILFSRPSVKLPLHFSKRCKFLDLGISRNSEDLTKYIEPLVHDLLESGELVLPELVTFENAVEKIVSKADGMFLWATLFMEYLRLPVLTISGRWKDIEDPSRFEGLYDLYEGIFAALRKNYPASTQVKVRRALQWVCGAVRPLHIEELRVAIEIEPDVVLGHHDLIPNFAQALGPISGALLEVTKDNTVRMIHLTLYEYLVSAAPNLSALSDNVGSTTTFIPQAVHYYASVSCLSYLMHNIPPGPYGTSTTSNLQNALPTGDYHFTEYATEFWISHVFCMYIEMKSTPEIEQYSQALEAVGASCVAFISDRIKFTSWIEALWRLGLQHQLSKLLGSFLRETFQQKSSADLPSNEASFMKALSLIRVVWEEQIYLISSWRRVLEVHPEEIWKPSISAFSRLHQSSPLHELSDDATMHTLAQPKTTQVKYTVIQSQVSSCGQELAVITVKKPDTILAGQRRHDINPPDDSRAFWAFDSTEHLMGIRSNHPDKNSAIAVSYQIWSLEDVERLIFEKSVDISCKSLVIATTDRSGQHGFFMSPFLFPASITPTLREVVFIDTFLKIFTSNSSSGIEFHVHVQKLDFPWIFQDSMPRSHNVPSQSFSADVQDCKVLWDDVPDEDLATLPTPGMFTGDVFYNTMSSYSSHIEFMSFYELILSPRGNFLLVLRRGSLGNEWSIDIFQDLAYNRRPDQPSFQWVAGQDLLPYSVHGHYSYPEDTELDEKDEVGNYGIGNQDKDPHPSTDESTDKEHNFYIPTKPFQKESSGCQSSVEIAFHPTLPQVTYATKATYLWNFGTMNASGYRIKEQPPLCIYVQPLSQMRYSSCGQRIHGFENFENIGAKKGVIVDLSELQSSTTPNSTNPTEESASQMLLFNDNAGSLSTFLMPEQRAQSIQMSNTSFIARDANGIPTLSTLQQSSEANSLTLHTFNTHGQSRQETLLRLPSDIADNGSITLLNPLQHEPGELRIVLEAPKRDYYTLAEQRGKVRLPAMIKRTVQSIPVVETLHGGIQQTLLEGQTSEEKIQKRD